MMTLHIDSYTAPDSLQEALHLLSENTYKIGCGCTDIFPQLRDGKFPSIDLLDLKNLQKDYSYVRLEKNGRLEAGLKGACLAIGAMTTHSMIAADELMKEYFPVLVKACAQIGSAQVRNRGTIGGNILNASPAADSVPALTAADAVLHLVSEKSERYALLNGFATRPGRTDIHPDEILTEILIPVENGVWQGEFFKVGPRNSMTISVADAAVLYNPADGFRIACGSVAASVVRAYETEKVFNGDGNEEPRSMIEKALETDISPIDDVRASGAYRRKVLINLLHNYYVYHRPAAAGER